LINLEKILFEKFGFEKFRDGQREIIEAIISGYPTLAILPTGGGKSLCYQLPAIIEENPSIVISPMISLMKDQVDKLNLREKIAGYINSSQKLHEAETVLREVYEGKIKLLYLSPEKISSPAFLRRLKEIKWKYLFVDEAHCISEWGHNFRPSYRKIYEFASELGFKTISAFTATATPEVRADIALQLRMENPKIFVRGFARPNLSLNVLRVKEKKSKLANLLREKKLPAIVYCSTRKETEEVADFLRLRGFAVNHYHAGLSSETRKLVQDDFLAGRLEVIAATNAFGMGIDKENIRTIVHYNIPASLEHYYQEIGRAGRDGKRSEVFLFYSKRDFAVHEYLIENSYPNEEEIKKVYAGVADYLRVAMGNLYEQSVAVDKSFLNFFETKNIGKAKLENALRALEASGYVKLASPNLSEYKIQYLLDPRDLKVYIKKIAKKEFAEILIALARKYLSAPFSQPVPVSLAFLANNLGITQNEVKERLHELDIAGILKFSEPQEFMTVRLTTTRVRAEDLQIENERNEELVKHALEKLRLIKRYAETDECRMRFILNYFGEENENYSCGICDNCTSEKDASFDNYLEEAIFDAANSVSEDIRVVDFYEALLGKSKKVNGANFPNYGALKDFSIIEIDEAFEKLVAKNKIKIVDNSIKAKKKVGDENTAAGNYEEELRLFNKLVEVRKETAKKFNQPLYMICSDEILRSIVKAKPRDEFELLGVKGFTRTMFNKFGSEILLAVRSHIENRK